MSGPQPTQEPQDSASSAGKRQGWEPGTSPCPPDLDVFVQVDRLIVDVVLQKVLVHAGQQAHLGQGEDVHELLHGVPVGALWAGGAVRIRGPHPAGPDPAFPEGGAGHPDPSPRGKQLSNNTD